MMRVCAWQNCIKACVLIENITASFQMCAHPRDIPNPVPPLFDNPPHNLHLREEILYELREHSAGLNCGIWDYSASFIARCVPLHTPIHTTSPACGGSLGQGHSYVVLGWDSC
jgi:hypothetical protein